jgi:hypothetical protein
VRRAGSPVDLSAHPPAWNGVQIARLKPPKHATARIYRVLPQNRALNPPNPLGTARPLRSHAYA